MHEITQQYQKDRNRYKACCQKIEVLIKELLTLESINFHKIESRTKDINSLEKKIYKKKDKYNSIADVTDIVALRIITYFEDEVDTIADIIKTEFNIDSANSCDKRISATDTFGYRSLHYVVTLDNNRQNLKEYNRFKDIKFEIQIRSILQHAWAEIEHDMGYKGINTVPDSFKRNFSMIAALLEMADRDFLKLRNESETYKKTVEEEIQSNPEDIDLNIISLSSYISSSHIIKNTDEELMQKINESTLEDGVSEDVIASYLEELKYVGINNIKKLEDSLVENKQKIIIFAKKWINKPTSFPRGICIFYLCYVLIGERDLDVIREYVQAIKLEGKSVNIAQKIKDIYQEISNENND